MTAHLIDVHGSSEVGLQRVALEGLRDRRDFYWLDIRDPAQHELELLGDVYRFHELAIEDATHFDQRPKVEEFDGFVFLVLYGEAPDEDDLVEVHCFYSERFLITVRREHCPAFAEARARQERRPDDLGQPILVLHRLLDLLVDSFFPLLADFDDEIDAIEEGIARRADEEQLRRIFLLKRRLAALRRVVAPQRDLLAGLASGVVSLPGSTPESERRFRDVYDHLIRLAEQIDSYRDLVTGVMDVYLSTVSNRLNVVMKQLAAIATIFLPLTFVTGFFGQNFGWMIGTVGGKAAFFALGVGIQVGALVGFLAFFRRRGWL